MHPLDPDTDLLRRAQAGDGNARHLVLAQVAAWLPRAVALRYPGYPGCEDLCQEVLLQVHLGLDRLQEPAAFRAWSLGVLRNCAAARFRGERRRPVLATADLDGPDAREARPAQPTPEDLAGRSEAWRRGCAALASLPEPLRQVYALFVEGHSLTEIAGMLGLPRGTAASRLRKAQADLRRSLGSARARPSSPPLDIFAPGRGG